MSAIPPAAALPVNMAGFSRNLRAACRWFGSV